METFKFDPNNTEGAYPDAFVAEGVELKKGNKIVATDLIDLYDVEINPLTLADEDTLVYEEVSGKWINMAGGTGVGCNILVADSTQVSPYEWVQYPWKQYDEGIWDYGFCTWVNDIYVVGGYSAGKSYDSWKYTPETNTWTALALFPASSSEFPAYLTGRGLLGKLYFFGVTSGFENVMYRYTISSNTWELLNSNIPPSFYFFNTVVQTNFKMYMYIWQYETENILLVFDPSTLTWSTGPVNPFLPAFTTGFITVTSTYGGFYIYGGSYVDPGTGMHVFSRRLYKYDAETEEWSYLGDGPIITDLYKKDMGAAFKNGFAIFGYDNEVDYREELWYYNVFDNTWSKETAIPNGFYGITTPFYSLSYAFSRLVIMGGYFASDSGTWYNTAMLHYQNYPWNDSLYVDANTTVDASLRTGMFNTPFISLNECFEWLRNKCITIQANRIITIHVLSDLYENATILNHIYGENIVIDGGGHLLNGDVHLTNNHTIKEIKNFTLVKRYYNYPGILCYTNGVQFDSYNSTYYLDVYHDEGRTQRSNLYFFDRFGDLLCDYNGNVVYLTDYTHPTYKDDFGNPIVFTSNDQWRTYDADGNIQPVIDQRYIMYHPDSVPEYDEYGEIQYDGYGNIMYVRGSRILWEWSINDYNGEYLSYWDQYYNSAGYMNMDEPVRVEFNNYNIILRSNASTRITDFVYQNIPPIPDGSWANDPRATFPLSVRITDINTYPIYSFYYNDERGGIFIGTHSSMYGNTSCSMINYDIENFSSLTLEEALDTSDSDDGNINAINSSIVVLENESVSYLPNFNFDTDSILIRYA